MRGRADYPGKERRLLAERALLLWPEPGECDISGSMTVLTEERRPTISLVIAAYNEE